MRTQKRWGRGIWLLLWVCGALVLGGAGRGAAPAVAPAGRPAQDVATSTFVTLFPELRTLPAPTWVRPGLRVSYYDASASVAQLAGEEGSGGAGLTQYDVVARERRVIPLAARLFLDQGGGRFQSSVSYGVLSPAGAGEFWVHPLALRRADRLQIEGLEVNRTEYEAAGEIFDAVRFDYTGEGSESAWVFDSRSGLLLFMRTSVEGITHDQLINRTLAGTRTLELPWQAGSAPPTLEAGDTFTFDGAFTTQVAGGDPIALPLQTTFEVTAAHAQWTEWTSTQAGAGTSAVATASVGGGAQIFGGLWLPEAALQLAGSAARSGRATRIDSDPLTGATVSYASDGEFVWLAETGSGFETLLVYGADGLLVRLRATQEIGLGVTVYDLQRTGN